MEKIEISFIADGLIAPLRLVDKDQVVLTLSDEILRKLVRRYRDGVVRARETVLSSLAVEGPGEGLSIAKAQGTNLDVQRSEIVVDVVDVDGPESSADLILVPTAGILTLRLLQLEVLAGVKVPTVALGPATVSPVKRST